MIPSLRQAFNSQFSSDKYQRFRRELSARCGMEVPFQVSETPCFFPASLVERLGEDGKTLIRQLVDSPEYHARSESTIPDRFRVANESRHPMFIQVDFGLVRDASGEVQPKLVELQAFPSLYAYQPVLAHTYLDVFGLDSGFQEGSSQFAAKSSNHGGHGGARVGSDSGRHGLRYYLSGLDRDSYRQLLADAIVAGHDATNVILMEVHPEEQKTLPDFLLTSNLLGIRTVCITKIIKEGRSLFYERDGHRLHIHRIYNRAIVDELERKGVTLSFDFRDDLDVEWAGHPNWYFRISKYSIPYLKHPSVPRTWFLDQMPEVPGDLENFVLKPLYSFAGLGVKIAPSGGDIDAIPAEKRHEYILQERMNFTPIIETPHGPAKAELRIMYIWLEELLPVMIIVRMGRGLMMGVDHNKNMQWVGSSAALISGS